MIKKNAGRPPKFSEPSRPVTVTLPERVLKKLQLVNSDRGLAIAKAVDNLVSNSCLERPSLEIVQVGDSQGLIIIGYSKALSQIAGIQLVEISPLRYLIAMRPGSSVDSLELALMDLIEHLPASESNEASLLLDLREILKKIRQERGVTKAEILLVPIA